MATVKPVVLWSLVGGLAVSVALAAKLGVDNRQLAGSVDQLTHQLTAAQETIAGQTDRISSLQTDLDGLETQLAQAEQEVTRLHAEQADFRQANAQLAQQVAQLGQDNDAMRAKLSSIKELKIAIRQVKAQLRAEQWQRWLARLQAHRIEDQVRFAQGNRGYLVRDGVSTVASTAADKAGAKLHVRVLEPQLE